MRATTMALVGIGFGLTGGCGSGDGITVETLVSRTTLEAGARVNARCEILDRKGEPAVDEEGEPLSETVSLVVEYEHPDSFGTDAQDEVIATRAGSATVRCVAPSIGKVDKDPVELEIVPGPPERVFTELDTDTTTAGEAVGVTCVAFDAFDNEVLDFSRSLSTSPSGDGVSVDDASVTATRTGEYEVTCVAMGASHTEGAFLQVLPGLPASLTVGLSPERAFYVIDQQVSVVPEARDEFGNRVDDVEFTYTSSPSIPSPSAGRFHFDDDGAFTLSVAVSSPTAGDAPLSESITVFVNSTGPTIECRRADDPSEPDDAYMLHQAPNTSITLPVSIADEFAVESVTMNGVAATLDSDSGNYEAGIPVSFGMNFVDVVAEDEFGVQNSTTCTFLASNRWTGEGSLMPRTVGLRLSPRALEGGSPTALDSLNDILHMVLNSQGLLDMVDEGLEDANPLVSQWCFGTVEINYTGGLSISSATTSTRPIWGGLRVAISIDELSFNAHLGGGCCSSTTGTVRLENIQAVADVDLSIQGGVLRASLDGEPDVTVENVDTNFGGTCGWAVNLLNPNGTVANALRDFIESDVGPMLDGVVSSLDVSTLAQSFQVPRLDGTGTITLGFGLGLSSLSATSQRVLLGIGTRFSPGQIGHNRSSLGVARPTFNPLLNPPGTSDTRPVGLSFYEGVLNQVLHALWRGGFFQADLQLGGGTASIDGVLPPVATVASGNKVQLMLGGIRAVVTIPGVISDPTPLTFGGRATANVSLSGDSLAFGAVNLDELYVSFEASLDQDQRDALEDFLRDVLQDVLADAINEGLPAIPIPAFTLPTSAADFGLPAGAELGLVSPLLTTHIYHYVLLGAFGVRD